MKAILLVFAMLLPASHADVNTDLQLMHTKPVCAHEGKTAAWCALEDMGPVATASGMIDKINAQLDLAQDPKQAKIYVAYFSFSNKGVFRKLCERARDGIEIKFFMDQVYRGQQMNNELTRGICNKEQQTEAQSNPGKYPVLRNVRFYYLGDTATTWRLHHNKFLIVDTGTSDDIKINFSSGNLSAFGTSLHFDHWVTATTKRNSNMHKAHECVVSALVTSVDPDGDGKDNDVDDADLYRTSLDQCLQKNSVASTEEAIKQEKIASFFSPNPANDIAETLIKEIKKIQKGESIVGATQHFLHHEIRSAMVEACTRGVDVKFIMDNDVISGESEVDGVTQFYNSYLDKTCVKIQFMQTNADIKQMMHNKFLVLGSKRVFAGAGHFTYAAMTDNYENFYLMEDASIHSQYTTMFNFMWNMSQTKQQVLNPTGKK